MRRVILMLLALPLSGCAEAPPAREAGPARRLVVAYPAGPRSLDPHDAQHEEFASSVLANVYEGLVQVEPDLALRPGLAESWHNPDDLTWVFVLRKGVRFHDGQELTARHVVECFERARTDAWLAGEVEPVVSVQARGDREVVFKTRERFSALPGRLTYFFVTAGPAGSPVGTGAYRARSFAPGRPVVLEAFDDYWQGAPPIREVEFRSIPDAAERARLVQRGEVQLTMDVRPDDRAGLAATPNVRMVARTGLRVVFLGLDTTRRPFVDRRVREAVALALDKDRLVAGPLAGLAERIEQLARPGEVGFDPALPTRPHDPERARRLLAQAGQAPGFDVVLDYPRGKYLEIEAVAGEIARQLQPLGIRVRPRPSDAGEHVELVEARRTSFFLLGWLNDTGSVQETFASLLATRGNGLGATNGSGWSHPPFDALLQQAVREPRNAPRGALLKEATRMVDAELPVIPLYCQRDLYAFSADLHFEPALFRRVLVSRLRFER